MIIGFSASEWLRLMPQIIDFRHLSFI